MRPLNVCNVYPNRGLIMHPTPIATRPVVRRDSFAVVRLLIIPLALGLSVIVASWGAYLFAIAMICLGVGLGCCVIPVGAPTGRRLQVGIGFIYASTAFVFLQLVTFLIAYKSA